MYRTAYIAMSLLECCLPNEERALRVSSRVYFDFVILALLFAGNKRVCVYVFA